MLRQLSRVQFMKSIPSCRVPVRSANLEPLLAVGVDTVLRANGAFDVNVHCPSGEVNTAPGGNSVVIADYDLGLQLAQAHRSTSGRLEAGRVQVLVMSARDREHEIRLALEQGVQGYLSAGCTPEELVRAVLTLAQGSCYLSPSIASRMVSSLVRVSLTSRELEVLFLLARGECNKVIARELKIAVATAKAHVQSIMEKLGASSRAKAICIANERGLIAVHAPALA
jgi:DNA-binding NarL/FixJ family response regulator